MAQFLPDSAPRWKFQAWMHFIVLIWGFSGSLGRLISLGAAELVWLRMSIAALALGLFITATKQWQRIGRRDFLRMAGLGLIIVVHWFTFFEAIKLANVSLALACLSTGPLFGAIIEPIAFRRRIQSQEIILSIGVIAGMLWILGAVEGQGLAIFYGLFSAFLASIFSVSNARMVQRIKASNISFWELFIGAMALAIWFTLDGEAINIIQRTTALDWFWLAQLGLICTAMAFMVSIHVMRKLSPFTLLITVALEPVYGILIALAIFGEGEAMSPGFYGGVLVILAMVSLNGWLKRRRTIVS